MRGVSGYTVCFLRHGYGVHNVDYEGGLSVSQCLHIKSVSVVWSCKMNVVWVLNCEGGGNPHPFPL